MYAITLARRLRFGQLGPSLTRFRSVHTAHGAETIPAHPAHPIKRKDKVAIVGSGNWGTVAARIVAQNTLLHSDYFEHEVKMWVFEEKYHITEHDWRQTYENIYGKRSDHMVGETELMTVARATGLSTLSYDDIHHVIQHLPNKQNGKASLDAFCNWWAHQGRHSPAYHKFSAPLSGVINARSENVKYLPGVRLTENLRAEPNLLESVKDASILVFVTPHQFIKGILNQLKPVVKSGSHVKAISLIKGMEVHESGFELISGLISKELGIDCSVLMGANIASEIGQQRFSEATVGYRNKHNGDLFVQLFDTPYFSVRAVKDVEGSELCGTLKNIVALGAGFIDGLRLGNNSKAAIIRIGLVEMKKLAQMLYPTVRDETFFESAGVADLITTCFGGRNRKVAEAFVEAGGSKTFEQLEKELLHGQKLQGVLTSQEVQAILRKRGWEKEFPLFSTINRIVNGAIPPAKIVEYASLP